MHMLLLFFLLARSLWGSSLSVECLSRSPSIWCVEEVDLFLVAPPAATGDTETLLAGVGGDEIVGIHGEIEVGQLRLDGGDKRCDCLLVYIVVQWLYSAFNPYARSLSYGQRVSPFTQVC